MAATDPLLPVEPPEVQRQVYSTIPLSMADSAILQMRTDTLIPLLERTANSASSKFAQAMDAIWRGEVHLPTGYSLGSRQIFHCAATSVPNSSPSCSVR